MTICKIILFIPFLIFFGCSSIEKDRVPASLPVSVEDIFSFKKGPTNDYPEKRVHSFLDDQITKSTIRVLWTPDDKLPNDLAYKILVDHEGGRMTLNIHYGLDALTNTTASEGFVNFLSHILSPGDEEMLVAQESFFELYYNASKNDLRSLDILLKLRGMRSSSYTYLDGIINSNADEKIIHLENPDKEFQATMDESNHFREQIANSLKIEDKHRKQQKLLRKERLGTLDIAIEDEQLKTLIAKGERKKAADLVASYLPFEDMPPFEKEYWENFLDIIKNPVPMKDRIFVYRGIDDDFIHSAIENGKKLSKEEAIKENKAFLMSTILVKNQGSWNRRLRSLESMYEKHIATNIEHSSEFTQGARITTMYTRHARKPEGSPFLSYTPRLSVARDFGSNVNSAFLIDPRLLNYNLTSHYSESEFIYTLFTFPEDLVGIWSKEYNANIADDLYFENNLKNKIVTLYGEKNADSIISQIKQQSEDFFKDSLLRDRNINDLNISSKTIFESIVEHNLNYSATKLNCEELISTFIKK